MTKLIVSIFVSKCMIGAFEYRSGNPESLFQHNRAAVDSFSPGSLINPAYLPLVNYMYLTTSGDNPYSIDELYSGSIGFGAGAGSTGLQFVWKRFGIKEYNENIMNFNVGFMPVKYLSVGTGIAYYFLQIDTEYISYRKKLIDSRFSVLIMPTHWLRLSFLQENIGAIWDDSRRSILFPEYSYGISIHAVKGLSIIWNRTGTSFGSINSYSVTANLLDFLSIRGGYSRETSTYSAAFSFILRNMIVSYGFRFHTYLGYTHSIGLSLTEVPVRYESLDYLTEFPDRSGLIKNSRININRCTIDELRDIPLLSDTMAQRIIKYRELIGPVTKKSLMQIGLSSRDITMLTDYIYGLKDEEPGVKEFVPRRRGYRSGRKKRLRHSYKKRKSLFIKLINNGINPGLSLKISEIAVKKSGKSFEEAIGSIPGISSRQKSRILKICAK